jgi:putative acetyltransferase
MHIREALDSDLDDVLFVEREAFGCDKEADLVRDLLNDPSAKPVFSLLAYKDDKPAGHILFTKLRLANHDDTTSMSILAPLAIVPDYQKQGIGGELIKKGLHLLKESGIDLVFVLGHPGYYPRYGFKTAGHLGFEAPYPIPAEVADAWMVQAFREDVIGSVSGKIICADALNKPKHWRE